MMQDTIDAILVMPPWVQAGLGLFVLIFLAMLIAPVVTHRAARRHFAQLAQGRRLQPGHDAFAESFTLEHGGRIFTIRRELRSPGRGVTYRGPRGHLVVFETPLSGSSWKMHQVDIARRRVLGRLGATPLSSGDAAFDARFTVWQDGLTVRDNWLDPPTRHAVTALFDAQSDAGTIWVQEGMLQYIHDTPAKLDGAALALIVDRQAALASALETTAGWRGPRS